MHCKITVVTNDSLSIVITNTHISYFLLYTLLYSFVLTFLLIGRFIYTFLIYIYIPQFLLFVASGSIDPRAPCHHAYVSVTRLFFVFFRKQPRPLLSEVRVTSYFVIYRNTDAVHTTALPKVISSCKIFKRHLLQNYVLRCLLKYVNYLLVLMFACRQRIPQR